MTENKFCGNCNQKHNCGSIYHQLGNIKGPSVVVKVVVAFLLPLVVFIFSLAAFQHLQYAVFLFYQDVAHGYAML